MELITEFIFTMSNSRKSPFKIIAIIGLISFTLFIAHSVVSMHIHTLPDGRIIIHSHPLKGDDDDGKNHRHSPKEITLIYIINSVLSNLLVISAMILFIKAVLYYRIHYVNNTFRSAPYLCHHDNRAPPPLSFTY